MQLCNLSLIFIFMLNYYFFIFTSVVNNMLSIFRLGLPYLFEDYVLGAKPYAINRARIKESSSLCSAAYGSDTINGHRLVTLSVTPNCRASDIKGVTLFFQGASVCVQKSSCFQNIVDMALRTKTVVIAYNQRHVSGSSGYHYHARSLRIDLESISQSVLLKLKSLRKAELIDANSKMFIYGLCQGGVLALMSAQGVAKDPDFSKIFVTRTPISFWEMAAYVPKSDYSPFMPKALKSFTYSWPGLKGIFFGSKLKGSFLKMLIQSHIIQMLSKVPLRVRAWVFFGLFQVSGWHVDCRCIIRRLLGMKKLFVISVQDDEFLSVQSDMLSFVKTIDKDYSGTCLIHVRDDYQGPQASDLSMQWPFDTESSWRAHYDRHCSIFANHQAWSQHIVDGSNSDEYDVFNRVCGRS